MWQRKLRYNGQSIFLNIFLQDISRVAWISGPKFSVYVSFLELPCPTRLFLRFAIPSRFDGRAFFGVRPIRPFLATLTNRQTVSSLVSITNTRSHKREYVASKSSVRNTELLYHIYISRYYIRGHCCSCLLIFFGRFLCITVILVLTNTCTQLWRIILPRSPNISPQNIFPLWRHTVRFMFVSLSFWFLNFTFISRRLVYFYDLGSVATLLSQMQLHILICVSSINQFRKYR